MNVEASFVTLERGEKREGGRKMYIRVVRWRKFCSWEWRRDSIWLALNHYYTIQNTYSSGSWSSFSFELFNVLPRASRCMMITIQREHNAGRPSPPFRSGKLSLFWRMLRMHRLTRKRDPWPFNIRQRHLLLYHRHLYTGEGRKYLAKSENSRDRRGSSHGRLVRLQSVFVDVNNRRRDPADKTLKLFPKEK